MRVLSEEEEFLVKRHQALLRARDRYRIYAHYIHSATALDSYVISSLEAVDTPSQQVFDALAYVLGVKAQRAQHLLTAVQTARAFEGLHEASFDQIQSELQL